MPSHGPKHREIPDPFKEWARTQLEGKKPVESTHLCSKCKTPFGKSAVRCPNEPKGTR